MVIKYTTTLIPRELVKAVDQNFTVATKVSNFFNLPHFSGVKQILERLISKETSESLIQAGKIKGVPLENCQMHKNLFFSLMYLHAMLESRKKYGALGWNISYQFD